MKKLFALLITLILCTSYIPVFAAENAPVPTADTAVLMDAATGTILYAKNPDAAFPPASTTKIMTALLVLEKTNLTDQVTVGKNPPFVDGSAVGIREGEILTVKDLLYGLLLESGNDCAMALAEHVGGTMENFVAMMNARAKELGCTNTNFVNPHGLYNKDHKISARDMALIMQELIKHPEYKEIATTLSHKIEPTNKSNEVRYTNNKNQLVMKGYQAYYKDCIGGKTGYTVDSQHSYVAAAERNGQRLIVALIHDTKKTYFTDAVNLFNYGFNNFQLKRLYSKGDEVSQYSLKDNLSIPLLAASDFFYVTEKNNNEAPTISLPQTGITSKSFNRGDKVLDADVFLKDTKLGSLSLASGIDYEEKPVLTAAQQTAKTASKTFKGVKYIIGILMSLFIILFGIRIVNLKRRRRLKKMRYFSQRYNKKMQ